LPSPNACSGLSASSTAFSIPSEVVRVGRADHELDRHILNLMLEAILVLAGAQVPAHLLPAQPEQIDPVDLDQPGNMLLAHLTLPLALNADILRPEAVSSETIGGPPLKMTGRCPPASPGHLEKG
jgi:hypothetical protein